MGREGLMDDAGYYGFDYDDEWEEEEIECEEDIKLKYFNYNYEKKCYEEVGFPLHDHYSYNWVENAYYEDVILNGKCYSYNTLLKED